MKLGKKNIRPASLLSQMLLWIYAFISIYPMFWMVCYSLKNNQEIFVTNPFGIPKVFRIENYVRAWEEFDVPKYFVNSLFASIATVIITILIAILFSYAVSRLRWKGREAVYIFISMGMFIPVQAILIPMARTVKVMNLMETRWGLIIPYAAVNLALACMVYYGFFKGIPVELEEAACIDGANIFQCFWKVIVPLVQPATATLVIYIFLNAWNEFILANVLIVSNDLKTLPLGILFFQGQFTTDWGAMGATMTIASLPTVVLYVLFSEQVERAMTIGGAVKG
ncbi:carbohydrate ABC transporter permease [Robinsoniella sp. KNHs210]|uniref:carbohydrate ABC transporter permease n=1 Tax=Robinsoniella sp. KNHs210 TaxID=1469950 RepID=UPI00048954E5|nr:carbohydrate ABC transporter permease [Robinsoniella sp. KNHs210]